jgi:NADH-quinone oxidoreductase subunit H
MIQELVRAVAILVGATAGTIVLGLFTRYVDRKVTARVQWRVGPPWYQPFVDILKLLGKETLVPRLSKGTLFLAAPIIGFSATALASAILWRYTFHPEGGFLGDLVVVMYLLTVPSLMMVLGPSSSGSPFAAVGASREMKLLLGYELPLVFCLVVAVFQTGGSVRIGRVLAGQAESGVVLGSLSGALAAIVALLCIQAKLGLVPFDAAEAETEIMGGVLVEYSGPPLALIHVTRSMLYAILPLFLITVFWGGLRLHGIGILYAVLKYLALIVLMVLIRNTNPRVRIDQAVRFFWGRMAPLAVAAAALAFYGKVAGLGWL